MPIEKSRVRTGYFDRFFASGLSQGNLAGYRGDPYLMGVNSYSTNGYILPRRDDILIQEGGGGPRAIEAYMRLFNDSQVLSAWTKLIGEVVQREWKIIPASQDLIDLEIAEFVRICLNKMGVSTKQSAGGEAIVSTNSAFDSFIRGMGESIVLGISVGEICWQRHGKYIIPSEIKIRDPRRFLFYLKEDGSVSPRVITLDSPIEGHPVPARSIIFHRHWEYSGFNDPYGSGLGRQLYSLVEFRRTLMSYWLQFADKHTTPTAIGSYALGTPEEDVEALLQSLQRMGQETAITVPEEIDIKWLQSDGRPEIYTDIITYIDQQISYVINGESTAGQDTGNVGSYARDQISDSIRKRKAKAFSEELDETLNCTLIRWLVELNYPGRVPPTLVRIFDDLRQKDDPVKVVQLMSQLGSMGYKIEDLDWIKEKLDIPSLYLDEEAAAKTQGGGGGGAPGNAMGGEPSGPKAQFGSPEGGTIDFIERTLDEQKEIKKTQEALSRSQELHNKINDNLYGVIDEIGFNRISIDYNNIEKSVSALRIDEFTTPGEILHSSKILLHQIDCHDPAKNHKDYIKYYSQAKNRQHTFETGLSTGLISEFDLDELIHHYYFVYRLLHKVVYSEPVVIDVKESGYWGWFKPYFINTSQKETHVEKGYV
jgi:phage gp29-like protein